MAYMDEGSAPLTDSTGRPVKFATLSVTAPGPDGQHTTLAIASVPAGYDIEAGAIQEALSNSLATGKGQSVLPPGSEVLGAVPKEYGSAQPSRPADAWSVWEGAVNTGAETSVGEVYFDDQGGAFTTRDSTVVSGKAEEGGQARVVQGYPQQQEQEEPGEQGSGSKRVCRRRMVNGKVRYYCRRQKK